MRFAPSDAAVAAGIVLVLAGCAPTPERIEILVNTTPPGASCVLDRQGQPIATAAPTPAIALIDAGTAEITVRCRRQGFADAARTLRPHPEAPLIGPLFAPPLGPYEQRVDIVLVPR